MPNPSEADKDEYKITMHAWGDEIFSSMSVLTVCVDIRVQLCFPVIGGEPNLILTGHRFRSH